MNSQYLKARKIAKKSFQRSVFKGEYPYIQSLEYHLEHFSSLPKKRIGMLEIPTVLIVGTTNDSRAKLFSCDFLPLGEENTEFAIKWENVLKYQEKEGISDAIKVYEYKHLFYVEEGNKRVSVAKFLDIPSILAEVIRVVDEESDELYDEFVSFFDCTNIYDIYFVKNNHYKKLAEVFNQSLDERWDKEVILELKNYFHRFCAASKKYIKGNAYESYSEAFLLYLEVYGKDAIKSIQTSEIKNVLKELSLLNDDHQFVNSSNDLKEEPFEVIKNMVSINHNQKKVAFIYESDPFVSSEVFMHELGRILVNDKLHKDFICERYENGNEEVIEKAIKEGADIIFTTSPELYEASFKSAIKHPNIKFYNRSIYRSRGTVETYDIKMYEFKYLLGALAAMLTKNNSLGYIADVPVYGEIANINAFAIGAQMINPNIKVYLGWKETLDQDWQDQMRYLGIDVFSGPELPSFVEYSTEYGLYKLEEEGVIQMASPIIRWDIYYEKLLNNYMNGAKSSANLKAISYWWGISSNVLDINMSSRIPYASQKMIESMKQGVNGNINPFYGHIYSNENKEINKEGVLTTEEIVMMDWLNDNVIGIIPQSEELTEHGKHLVHIHGVDL